MTNLVLARLEVVEWTLDRLRADVRAGTSQAEARLTNVETQMVASH